MTDKILKKTIWITGASGFLGQRLAGHFTSMGHRVIGFSRRPALQVELSVVLDLAAPAARTQLKELIGQEGRPEVLIHAASRQPGAGTLADFVSSNVTTTSNLIAAFDDSPPARIIYTSTQSVYSRSVQLPVKEDQPAGGSLPYSATKRWGEELLESLTGEANVTVLRLPSLYGAGQADSLIDGLARCALRHEPIKLFSRGELIRDALHVSDVVKGIAACCDLAASAQFSIMNLGCGRPIKTLEYANELVAALKSESKIIPVEQEASGFDLYADIEEARRTIGFEPMSLTESMRVYANELQA